MRHLFARFFASFGIAIVVVVAGAIAATLWFATTQRFAAPPQRAGELVAEARAALGDGGEPALRAWLIAKIPQLRPARLYLLDESGRELLGREPPGPNAPGPKAPGPDAPMGPMAPPPQDFGERPPPMEGRGPPPDRELVAPDGRSWRVMYLPPKPGARGPWGAFGRPQVAAALLVLALLASLALSYLLARSFSRPIARLREATRRLADGRLSERVAPELAGRRDELGALAHDFDAMAARLEALLESRRQLFRDMSHELRTPLARLRLAIGLLQQNPADAARHLAQMERETERVDELIGRMLQLSRLEDGAVPLARSRFDVAGLLEEIVRDSALESEAKGVSFDIDCAPDLEIEADRALLASAFENVVRNAIRHTPAASRVHISARREADGFVRVTIADQGTGVPPELLERIFEPLFRVSQAREGTRGGAGGHGIGLAICARVARLHGGSVSARNRPGGGLEVTTTILDTNHR